MHCPVLQLHFSQRRTYLKLQIASFARLLTPRQGRMVAACQYVVMAGLYWLARPHCSLLVSARYIEGRPCHVLWSVGLHQPADLPDLLARLGAQGFPSRDISAIQAAQARS